MAVTFEDVTIAFMLEEWKFLDSSQKYIYWEVMWENYTNVMSVGNLNESYKPHEEILKYLEYENFPCWRSAGLHIYENQNHKETIQEGESKDASQCQELLIFSTQAPGYGNYELTFEGKNSSNLKYKKCICWQSLETKNNQDYFRDVCMSDSHGFQGDQYHLGICRKNLPMERNNKLIVQHSYIPVEEDLPEYIGELCQNNLLKDSMQEKYCGCNKCKEVYFRKSQYVLQKKTHLGEKLYQYSISTAYFAERSDLYRHPRIHTAKKLYGCNEVGSNLSQSSGVHYHQEVCAEEIPSICNVCDESFRQISYLHGHQRAHREMKLYESECDKDISRKSLLHIHKRLHIAEKPFQCDQCSKCFSRNSVLHVHQRVHTGEKPYKCDECSKGFSQSSNLRIHQLVHTGEKSYKCDDCGKCFTQHSNLQIHQRVHTGEKPYKCHDCGKDFGQSSALHIHQRVHMREEMYKCHEYCKGFDQNSHLHNNRRKETL